MSRPSTKTLTAAVTAADSGGFTAIASTGSIDRDGEILMPGCFNPLPASVPIHIDHNMSVAGLVGRGVPYYEGNVLKIHGTFSGTPAAQDARQKTIEGVLGTVSVAFHGAQYGERRNGAPTIVKAELLAVDLVTIPSNRDAQVLAVRGYSPTIRSVSAARLAVADAMLDLARAELKSTKGASGERPSTFAQRRMNAALNGDSGSARDYLRRHLAGWSA